MSINLQILRTYSQFILSIYKFNRLQIRRIYDSFQINAFSLLANLMLTWPGERDREMIN